MYSRSGSLGSKMEAVAILRSAPALLRHTLLARKVNSTSTMLCTSVTISLHVPTCLIFGFSNPSQPFPAHDLSVRDLWSNLNSGGRSEDGIRL